MVHQEQLDFRESQVLGGKAVLLDNVDSLDNQDQEEKLVCQDPKDNKADQDLKDQVVTEGNLEKLGNLDLMDNLVHVVCRVQLELEVNLVSLDQVVREERPVHAVNQAHQDHKEHRYTCPYSTLLSLEKCFNRNFKNIFK